MNLDIADAERAFVGGVASVGCVNCKIFTKLVRNLITSILLLPNFTIANAVQFAAVVPRCCW